MAPLVVTVDASLLILPHSLIHNHHLNKEIPSYLVSLNRVFIPTNLINANFSTVFCHSIAVDFSEKASSFGDMILGSSQILMPAVSMVILVMMFIMVMVFIMVVVVGFVIF